jgi:uncharacterized protein YjlB
MAILEDTKKIAERATGIGRPKPQDLRLGVRDRVPQRYRFRQSGLVPNHPRWPLIHYRSVVRFRAGIDPAALFEDLFERNGWDDSWRDGVYDYLHYHARIHEVMGVGRGFAVVQFGGKSGRKLRVKAGDVVVLPAGTGHELISASKDFLVVGAYPATGTYDLCKPTAHAFRKAIKSVPRVPPPRKDPVYGKDGKLPALWKKARTRKSKAAQR